MPTPVPALPRDEDACGARAEAGKRNPRHAFGLSILQVRRVSRSKAQVYPGTGRKTQTSTGMKLNWCSTDLLSRSFLGSSPSIPAIIYGRTRWTAACGLSLASVDRWTRSSLPALSDVARRCAAGSDMSGESGSIPGASTTSWRVAKLGKAPGSGPGNA